MTRRCQDCIWCEDCKDKRPCRDFSPANEDAYDMMLEKIIESERASYYEEWQVYVDEYA